MKRKNIFINGLNISYLDNEKRGQILICLHGHYGSASMFTFLNNHFDGHLILIDQRGHGLSDHANSYKRIDYVNDLRIFIETLKIEKPIILGHSLGGVNAYQYCSYYGNIAKLIIEDIGTEIPVEINIKIADSIASLPEEFDSIWDVTNEFSKINLIPFSSYFMENLFYEDTKWKFRFNYNEIANSTKELIGTYWKEWEKIECPILLLHGLKSPVCTTENVKEMANRNNNVTLEMFNQAGHFIHDDEREKIIRIVLDFINK